MIIKTKKPEGFSLMYTNHDPFEMGIVEMSSNDDEFYKGFIGYIHAENPTDQNVMYIKLQHNPTNKIYTDQKGGIRLQDFINFLQDLHDEEVKVRKLG